LFDNLVAEVVRLQTPRFPKHCTPKASPTAYLPSFSSSLVLETSDLDPVNDPTDTIRGWLSAGCGEEEER